MNKHHGSILALVLAITLAACGGGGGGGGGSSGGPAPVGGGSSSSESSNSSTSNSSSSAPVGALSGIFLDEVVEGMKYQTATVSGITGPDGKFTYNPGEQIVFTVYDTVLDSAKAAPILTPVDVKGLPDVNYIVNLLRVLQSADADGNPYNGIKLLAVAPGEVWNFDLNQSIEAFEADPKYLAFVAKYSVAKTPVKVVDALSHFSNTIVQKVSPGNTYNIVGKTIKYSVKSSFCSNPDTWYGTAQMKTDAAGYTLTGRWSSITHSILHNGSDLPMVNGSTCVTDPHETWSGKYYSFGNRYNGNGSVGFMLTEGGVIKSNQNLIWQRPAIMDPYGREGIELWWRTRGENVIYHVITYTKAGSHATYGSHLGSMTEKYEFVD